MSPPVHDRLLDAAEALIVQHGLSGISTEAILARADAGRRTLYTHFGSKEELIVQALHRRDDRLIAWFEDEVRAAGDLPAARIMALIGAFGRWFRGPDFNGFAFVALLGEAAPEGRANDAARRHKSRFGQLVASLADDNGFRDPEALKRKLLIVIEGAAVAALVEPASSACKDAKALAGALLKEHSHKRP